MIRRLFLVALGALALSVAVNTAWLYRAGLIGKPRS